MRKKSEDDKKMLSDCESLVMQAIWDSGTDISTPELIETLRVRFRKDYKRSTVATFLLRLSEKGFVETYRKGRIAYVHALKSEEEYRSRLMREETDFWFGGSVSDLLDALGGVEELSKQSLKKIRDLLDDLDD